MTMSWPVRKHPSHQPTISRMHAPTILLVTVCVPERRHVLDRADVHSALCAAWESARQWRVGVYVIMPDHLHLFCSPAVHDHEPVGRWVRFWKSTVSRQFPQFKPLWQRDCWDTQMRNREHYDERLHYVRANPIRAGLVTDPASWPYQGKLNDFPWM